MATIDSVKLPDNSTYDLTDNYSGYQKQTLTTPLTINGTQKANVEGALGGLNDYGDALADNLAANEESGAKNKLTYPYYETTKTLNGITFTDNGNGTVTVSGTASADATFDFTANFITDPGNAFSIVGGNYILSGCPVSGSLSSYYIYARHLVSGAWATLASDVGNGSDFTINTNEDDVQLYIIVKSGTAITTPITFKPMIRDARVIDPTFAPYAMTNRELTEELAGETGTFTLTYDSGTYTDGFTSQTNYYKRIGGLVMIRGELELTGAPDSSHSYVVLSGLPFKAKRYSVPTVGSAYVPNNAKLATTRITAENTLQISFTLADGTYPFAGHLLDYTIIYEC